MPNCNLSIRDFVHAEPSHALERWMGRVVNSQSGGQRRVMQIVCSARFLSDCRVIYYMGIAR